MKYTPVDKAIRMLARRLYGTGKVTINTASERDDRGVTRHYARVRVARPFDEAGRDGRKARSPARARVVLARELATLLTRATIADAAVLRAIPSELRPPAKGG